MCLGQIASIQLKTLAENFGNTQHISIKCARSFVVLCCGYIVRSLWICVDHLSISFGIAWLILGYHMLCGTSKGHFVKHWLTLILHGLKDVDKAILHSTFATLQPLEFGNSQLFHPTLHWACDWLSMMETVQCCQCVVDIICTNWTHFKLTEYCIGIDLNRCLVPKRLMDNISVLFKVAIWRTADDTWTNYTRLYWHHMTSLCNNVNQKHWTLL